jgi:trans-aconitate 2-methyltransferase
MDLPWNPDLYLKFNEERTRPARDLAMRAVALLGQARAVDVVDLGCGPGNSTTVLAELFPGARLVGVDSSQEMIDKARAAGLAARWVVADAAAWQPAQAFDLVFSNAMLQWLPDQDDVVRRMWSWLRPGGVLAVQVPANGASPLHRALSAVSAGSRWSSCFGGLGDRIRYREPDHWHDTLAAVGARADVWETTYWHVLDGQQALIDWYASTGLRPWLERLDAEMERQAFKEEVLRHAAPSYPVRRDGTVLFPFRRVFFTAQAPR